MVNPASSCSIRCSICVFAAFVRLSSALPQVGTPYYVSPEVVKGSGYDWKSDVWSLGCLLYELAVLKSPFETEGANLYDVFQKINAGDYRPLPKEGHSKVGSRLVLRSSRKAFVCLCIAGCAQVLRDLVTKMLQTDPAQRPSMEDVWQITRGVFDQQHYVSRSTHLMSEQAVDKITLLAFELRRQASAREVRAELVLIDAPALPCPGRQRDREGPGTPLTVLLVGLCSLQGSLPLRKASRWLPRRTTFSAISIP